MTSNNNDDLKFIIPSINNDNNEYRYDKFKVVDIPNKGLGVVVTEDLKINDINSFIVYGGILYNSKQFKKYMKLNNDLKFDNNKNISNISHITKASLLNENENYLIANPILYNNPYKFGWIGSYVNEVSENSNEIYNAELIVLSDIDKLKYKSSIDKLPNCIDKRYIVGIRIIYAIRKGMEVTAYYNGL